jgi:hypothetical protein
VTTLIAALALLSPLGQRVGPEDPRTLEVPPTDDVWVYMHASEGATEEFLRVWGIEGASVGDPSEGFSYAYLRFDLAGLPERFKLREAKLILVHAAGPAFKAELVERCPLEARRLGSDFDEKSWSGPENAKVSPKPSKEDVYGTGFPKDWPTDKEFSFEIGLLGEGSPFAADIAAAREKETRALGIALTTTLDPSEAGRGGVYKLRSKNGPKETVPILKLVYEAVPLIRRPPLPEGPFRSRSPLRITSTVEPSWPTTDSGSTKWSRSGK